MLAQDIVGATPHEDAVLGLGHLEDGLALYLEQRLLRDGAVVVAVANPAQPAGEASEE